MEQRRIGFTMALVLIALGLGACGTPGIVRVSADTYRVSRADPGHVFADAAAMKAAAVGDADAFARSKGMIAVPVSFQEDTLAVGHLKTVDYQFRLVPPGEPAPSVPVATAAAAPAMPFVPAAPAPVVAPAAASPAAPVPPASQAAKPARGDYYEELIRLDDLRKRGILTEDEFQRMKAKIIAER
jgi:hypothetical protein